MPKFCNNGHQMEDSWEICPYCQRTGYQTGGSGPAKTRLEMESIVAAKSVTPSARKTVLLNERPHKAALVGWLVAMDGEQKGEDFRIRDGQTVIGSAPDVDVVLRDVTISAKHASLRYKDSKFFLTDLDSTNGTFVNDGPESIARAELKDSDLIRIGAVTLKFKVL